MSDNAPAPTVWGTFQARDARAMIAFLVSLGFEETVVYGEGDYVDHAQLDWPEGGGIMLGSTRNDGNDAAVTAPGACTAYIVVDEPDALCARVRAGGAEAAQNRAAGSAVLIVLAVSAALVSARLARSR